jgi:hypothetical protein
MVGKGEGATVGGVEVLVQVGVGESATGGTGVLVRVEVD